MVQSILCPSESATSLPKLSHRPCVAVSLCRRPVPGGWGGWPLLGINLTRDVCVGESGSARFRAQLSLESQLHPAGGLLEP